MKKLQGKKKKSKTVLHLFSEIGESKERLSRGGQDRTNEGVETLESAGVRTVQRHFIEGVNPGRTHGCRVWIMTV